MMNGGYGVCAVGDFSVLRSDEGERGGEKEGGRRKKKKHLS
jgi:hypothetical protein